MLVRLVPALAALLLCGVASRAHGSGTAGAGSPPDHTAGTAPEPLPEHRLPDDGTRERVARLAHGMSSRLGLPVRVDCSELPCMLLVASANEEGFVTAVSEAYEATGGGAGREIVAVADSACIAVGAAVEAGREDVDAVLRRVAAWRRGPDGCGAPASP